MSPIPPRTAASDRGAVVGIPHSHQQSGGSVSSIRMVGLFPSNPHLVPISPAPTTPQATARPAYTHILPNVSPYETSVGLQMMGPKRKITHDVSEDGSNASVEGDEAPNKNKKQKRSSSSSTSDLYLVQASDEPIVSFNDQDVLSGRGGGTNAHPGNRYFRDLIQEHRCQYLKARKNDKPTISRTIVKKVREAGGRFLKKHKTYWVEIGDYAAREKTSQALRQRAPEMRQMMFQAEANETAALGGGGAAAAVSNTLAPPHPTMATHEPAPAPAVPPAAPPAAAHCVATTMANPAHHHHQHHQDHHSVHHHTVHHHHHYEDPQHQQEAYAHHHSSAAAPASEQHHHPHPHAYVPLAPAHAAATTAASPHRSIEDRYHHHQHHHAPPAPTAPVDETKDDPVHSASLLHALGTSHLNNSSATTHHHRESHAQQPSARSRSTDDEHHHYQQQQRPEASPDGPAYHHV